MLFVIKAIYITKFSENSNSVIYNCNFGMPIFLLNYYFHLRTFGMLNSIIKDFLKTVAP